MRLRLVQGITLLSIILAACSDGGIVGPSAKDLVIAVQSGDQQVGLTGTALPQPLKVIVKNGATDAPAKSVSVTWQANDGATVSPAASVTDSAGIASTTLTLGATTGAVTVSATFAGNVGSAASFTAEATSGASVTGISPTSANAGDTVTITGSGFSATAQNNVVLFDGVRGVVVSATATQLRVVVPPCMPTRTVQVEVVLGPTTSSPVSLAVTGVSTTALNLAVGQVSVITDVAAGCVQLPAGGNYLVAVQNATTDTAADMPFQLLGLGSGAPSATGNLLAKMAPLTEMAPLAARQPTQEPQFALDAKLHRLERQLLSRVGGVATPFASRMDILTAGTLPKVGDTSSFKVLNSLTDVNSDTTVRAVVKLVTTHAIIYQDVRVPSGGFSATDFQQFGQLFDDPIFPTDSTVFGGPSDIDSNGHIIILFTPVVNSLSPKGASSFVAGFFFGGDLVPVSDYPGSNQAEIFYAAVPDPNGTLGPTLSASRILQTTPPVLAHEFTHMIAWNQRVILRGGGDDDLWVDESLAHSAEDTVGGVFLSRGDTTTAVQFMAENWGRADEYLTNTAATALLAYVSPGTLAERGAGWLFFKYLRGRFGGGVLGRLTQTTLTGTANVTAATGSGWSGLVNDWAIALWADGAPDLAAATVDPRYTFPNFNLRPILGQPALSQSGYPLVPATESFSGFSAAGTVLPSTAAYFLVTGAGSTQPVSLALSGPGGVAFSGRVAPQLGIMRVK